MAPPSPPLVIQSAPPPEVPPPEVIPSPPPPEVIPSPPPRLIRSPPPLRTLSRISFLRWSIIVFFVITASSLIYPSSFVDCSLVKYWRHRLLETWRQQLQHTTNNYDTYQTSLQSSNIHKKTQFQRRRMEHELWCRGGGGGGGGGNPAVDSRQCFRQSRHAISDDLPMPPHLPSSGMYYEGEESNSNNPYDVPSSSYPDPQIQRHPRQDHHQHPRGQHQQQNQQPQYWQDPQLSEPLLPQSLLYTKEGSSPLPPPPPPPLPGDPDQNQQIGYGDDDGLLYLPDNEESEFQRLPTGSTQLQRGNNGVATSDNTDHQHRKMDLSAFDKEYILKGLARLYRKKILPLELSSRYGHFHSPPLSPSDFAAPPMVLLLGQYSVGKSSFCKYLVGRDFPGIRIGPEPTTDRFTAILYGSQDKIVPGAALCSQADRPFTGLSPFGNNFLSRFEGAELNSAILRNITIVDTPGILSGAKQRSRSYDYEAVIKWMAERSDLIIVMFDAHKLDISDELKRSMELLIPHLDKIRIVLNKADQISTQQLMRVYGALMWSLGKVMNTPEVCRVYMGSFWDAPLHNSEQAELLQREELDLIQEIMALPQQAVMRRINEMVKRARSVKVHAYLIHYLRKQLPYTWGKKEKQRRLIGRLESEFMAAARRYNLPKGDFPPLETMRQALYEIKDLSEFPKLDKKLVRDMDKVFSMEIPDLLDKARNH